ncbi:hypothetical protein [Paracoccus aminophilus]|uniref:Uncharacterized protein n=1 Tax=Paracoccus aminophilus JCM 7686 TaxID=1367847 RepID=S5XYB8_PARAH|nr:hypothetical protein [Paracoccus aminophilus]AGT08445.1 hypothetical protein JCM7686_1344 [Paracoccus aminophilus JCM 7686]
MKALTLPISLTAILLSAGLAAAESWSCKLDELCSGTECKVLPAHEGFALSLDRTAGKGLLTAKNSPDQPLQLVGSDADHTNWFSQGTTRKEGYSGDTFVTLNQNGAFAISFHALTHGKMTSAVFTGGCAKS